MSAPQVVARVNLPARLPLTTTIAGWLLLDRMAVPSWAFGAFWTVAAILWIVAIIAMWAEEHRTPVWKEGDR